MQLQHVIFELREKLRKQKRLLEQIPKDILESVQIKKMRKER